MDKVLPRRTLRQHFVPSGARSQILLQLDTPTFIHCNIYY